MHNNLFHRDYNIEFRFLLSTGVSEFLPQFGFQRKSYIFTGIIISTIIELRNFPIIKTLYVLFVVTKIYKIWGNI